MKRVGPRSLGSNLRNLEILLSCRRVDSRSHNSLAQGVQIRICLQIRTYAGVGYYAFRVIVGCSVPKTGLLLGNLN